MFLCFSFILNLDTWHTFSNQAKKKRYAGWECEEFTFSVNYRQEVHVFGCLFMLFFACFQVSLIQNCPKLNTNETIWHYDKVLVLQVHGDKKFRSQWEITLIELFLHEFPPNFSLLADLCQYSGHVLHRGKVFKTGCRENFTFNTTPEQKILKRLTIMRVNLSSGM